LLTVSLSKLSCHSPRSEALVFALRLYCYLILQVCVPALWLDRPSSGPRYQSRYQWCFSDVLRHQSEVLNVLWTVVMLSSPRYYTCHWINVSPSGPEPSLLSDVCQTVHSVGSFHLSFHLPFRLPFRLPCRLPFPFPSFPIPPPDLGENIF